MLLTARARATRAFGSIRCRRPDSAEIASNGLEGRERVRTRLDRWPPEAHPSIASSLSWALSLARPGRLPGTVPDGRSDPSIRAAPGRRILAPGSRTESDFTKRMNGGKTSNGDNV